MFDALCDTDTVLCGRRAAGYRQWLAVLAVTLRTKHFLLPQASYLFGSWILSGYPVLSLTYTKMYSSLRTAGAGNLGIFMDAVGPQTGPVVKWDGAARNVHDWDDLRKVCCEGGALDY